MKGVYMKTKYLLLVLICSIVVFVSGCREGTVYNVDKHGFDTNIKDYTEKDVLKAIERAGSGLGWIISPVEPGHATGTLYLRSHMAKVDIYYDLEGYSIKYNDSSNLDYIAAGEEYTDASGETQKNETGTIHSNYNGWIQNLDNAIRTQLGNL